MKPLHPASLQVLQYRTQDITPEEVKALPTFQHYTDEQVALLIQTIQTFTRIGYAIFIEQEAITGRVIELPPVAENKQKAA